MALALNEQVLPPEETVPSDATDYKLDALIMGNGEVIRANPVHMDSVHEKKTAV